MQVGMASIFQNPGRVRADREVYRSELRLADLAEPLGFQSIWGVEHHFTDYTMCPDVLQFLSYMAGRTDPRVSSARWWWCCPGTIRCASPRRCRCSTPCPTAASSSGLGRGVGQGRVRRLPAVHGRVAPALRRDGADAAEGPRAPAIASTTASSSSSRARDIRPAPVQVVPRPHLCGGGLAGVGAHHGRARRRHPDHSPEALGRRSPRSSRTIAGSTAR